MRKKPDPQQWDDEGNRVRVLLECRPAASPSIIASAIESRGYSVRTCEGPSVERCTLVSTGACALVDGADVVVNLLGRSPRAEPVLPAVAGLRRRPQIVAEVHHRPGRESEQPASTAATGLEDAVVGLPSPLTTQALFTAIDEALRRRDQRSAWWGDGFC